MNAILFKLVVDYYAFHLVSVSVGGFGQSFDFERNLKLTSDSVSVTAEIVKIDFGQPLS